MEKSSSCESLGSQPAAARPPSVAPVHYFLLCLIPSEIIFWTALPPLSPSPISSLPSSLYHSFQNHPLVFLPSTLMSLVFGFLPTVSSLSYHFTSIKEIIYDFPYTLILRHHQLCLKMYIKMPTVRLFSRSFS
uniref:Uncharacterized protein n=1 Tax=Equus asinus TaxID=9793 RepID=A0A9L0I810_EQUAS